MSIAIALALALAALSIGRNPAYVPATVRSVENIRLSDPASGYPFAEEPHVAVDSQGRVFVGWKALPSLTGIGAVAFASSSDGGRTWRKRLMEGGSAAQPQSDPWLTVDELDRVYYSRGGIPGVVVSRSDDGGENWGPLVNAADSSGRPDKDSIHSDRHGIVYVSYSEGRTNLNDWRIRVARSTDGGATWSHSAPVAIGRNLFASVLAATPQETVVIWLAPGTGFNNIMASRSSDRGASWGAPVRINPVDGSAAPGLTLTPQRLSYPSAATNSRGEVFVAWADVSNGTHWDILVARSSDGGATWSAPLRVNDTPAGDQWTAALAIDGQDRLHAAWYDSRTGGVNVFYATSTDGGASWSENLRITSQETPQATTTRLSEYFGLAADHDGNAYLAWTDWRDGGPAIYFARVPACAPPSAPSASNNGPIRVGQTLQLTASTVAGATYEWTGPNGFRSSLQNPSIPNATTAASGTYTVTAMAGGCASAPATTIATVLPPPCVTGNSTLCLNASRFTVEVAWRVPSQGTSGAGRAVPLTSDTGYFWFFDSANVELVVKVLDGRGVNGRFWVFYGALSDVEYTMTVTDTDSGAVRTYFNPQGRLASVADTSAF